MSKLELELSEDVRANVPQHIERVFETEHIRDYYMTDRVKKILSGKSHASKGLTQAEIATLFMFGVDGRSSSTDNFSSYEGVLMHYSTIEAIRTNDGLIISNRDCWERGFAHCTDPPHVDYALNLSAIQSAFNRYTLRTIKIIEHVKESQNDRSATLLTITEKYLPIDTDREIKPIHEFAKTRMHYVLNAFDEYQAFAVVLSAPCKTVKEAFESMKPKSVLLAEKMNKTVVRQGDLFFIETDVKTSQVRKRQKRRRKPCMRAYYQCKKCGIKTKRFISERDGLALAEDGETMVTKVRHIDEIEYARSHPYVSFWHSTATQKQKDCNGTKEDMQLIEYKSFEYDAFPQIANTDHTATRLGEYVEFIKSTSIEKTLTFTVVKGVVRHSEHASLKLKMKTWHIVAPNQIKRSLSARNMRAD